ncbi:hypothetical protein SLE2022_015820 [Rubroshorea leprosula]
MTRSTQPPPLHDHSNKGVHESNSISPGSLYPDISRNHRRNRGFDSLLLPFCLTTILFGVKYVCIYICQEGKAGKYTNSKSLTSKSYTSMALFSSFLSCFSGSNKVVCEGDDSVQQKSSKVKAAKERKSNPPPIPVSYFPIGSRLCRL